MNVLASLLVLGLLIFFHELGHFLAARLQGIHVNGFSIGFGPAIFKKEFAGITYSIRALPLGGFVSFPDDDIDSKIPKDDPNLLRNRPLIQRAFVISAGVLANLLLAWLVLIGQAALVGIPSAPEPGVLIMSVQPGQPAESSDLVSGDQILSIDGLKLGKGQEAVQLFVEQIQNAPGRTIKLERLRGTDSKIVSIKPRDQLGSGKIGAQLQPNISERIQPAKGPNEILKNADGQFSDLLTRTITGYQGLITDFGSTSKQLSGPVKIVEIGAQLSEKGSSGLVLFAALVSINLAVLNSLPLPLLDGGQMALLLIEGVRGKPVPQKIQMAFIQSGFLLLVGLSVVLIIRDTAQLSIVQALINR
ncbi:RIP metalloprotease RseP [Prochlorococcus sp. MIT 1307]|uniref:RIP metalloprotease RseP n=1 Tax=Prochlorococcus sp. MIT 1307 TaxID=3096219 RepID=UPI002A76530E|nr:RIP metalloprotease RseP [Prochlorococcus sp. MIT 1307]